MKKCIIDLDDRYEFAFFEEKMDEMHPASEYYFILHDLSININISIKWIRWGHFFLNSLSDELDNIKDIYNMESLITESIQKIKEEKEEKRIFYIDKIEIIELNNFIDNLPEYYNDNTKINLKMKLNLRDYLILTNVLYPSLVMVTRVNVPFK